MRLIALALATAVAMPLPAGAQTVDTASAFSGFRIDHHAIGVNDFDVVTKWYVEKLNFRVEKTWTVAELPGARLGYLIGPGDYRVEVVSGGKGPRTPSGATFADHFNVQGYNHICFWVDDLDATANELVRRGVKLFFQPTDFAKGAERRIFFVKDPEGNVIEFAGRVTGAAYRGNGQ